MDPVPEPFLGLLLLLPVFLLIQSPELQLIQSTELLQIQVIVLFEGVLDLCSFVVPQRQLLALADHGRLLLGLDAELICSLVCSPSNSAVAKALFPFDQGTPVSSCGGVVGEGREVSLFKAPHVFETLAGFLVVPVVGSHEFLDAVVGELVVGDLLQVVRVQVLETLGGEVVGGGEHEDGLGLESVDLVVLRDVRLELLGLGDLLDGLVDAAELAQVLQRLLDAYSLDRGQVVAPRQHRHLRPLLLAHPREHPHPLALYSQPLRRTDVQEVAVPLARQLQRNRHSVNDQI